MCKGTGKGTCKDTGRDTVPDRVGGGKVGVRNLGCTGICGQSLFVVVTVVVSLVYNGQRDKGNGNDDDDDDESRTRRR